jgi:hypothetical protein
MPELRRAAVVVLSLLLGLAAQADDGTVDLDSVDTGHTVDQDSLDTGHTTSLDSADTGKTVDQDSLDTGTMESLDAAEAAPEAPPSLPAALPQIADDSLRAQAQAARDTLVDAEHRYAAANAAYSEMRAHDFPRGEAAAAIVKEHTAARLAYEQASAGYTEILQQVDPAAIDD